MRSDTLRTCVSGSSADLCEALDAARKAWANSSGRVAMMMEDPESVAPLPGSSASSRRDYTHGRLHCRAWTV
jgi:hypothetical protein